MSARDERVRHAVLALALAAHPVPFRVWDLARMLSEGPDDHSVERAVRDLVGAGLLHCRDGSKIVPSAAALRADGQRP